jgi:beta-aspartyl-peptidase (threonine type)
MLRLSVNKCRNALEARENIQEAAMSKGLRAAILLVILVAPAALVSAHQKRTGEPRAAQEIRAVLESQERDWNRGDLEGFMQGYWRSPLLTFYSGGTVVSGWQPTLDRYRARYQSGGNEMGKLTFSDLKIEVLGPNAAFVRGRFHLKMTSGESGGLFTLTFRKVAGGWKIVHDHTSTS